MLPSRPQAPGQVVDQGQHHVEAGHAQDLRDGRTTAHDPQRHLLLEGSAVGGDEAAQGDRVHELDIAQVHEDLLREAVQDAADLAVEAVGAVQVERPADTHDGSQAASRGRQLEVVRHLSSLQWSAAVMDQVPGAA